MSASLVGSEMCIRDRQLAARALALGARTRPRPPGGHGGDRRVAVRGRPGRLHQQPRHLSLIHI
eukprot:7330386-Alexandrium_andersonii.AAC.1